MSDTPAMRRLFAVQSAVRELLRRSTLALRKLALLELAVGDAVRREWTMLVRAYLAAEAASWNMLQRQAAAARPRIGSARSALGAQLRRQVALAPQRTAATWEFLRRHAGIAGRRISAAASAIWAFLRRLAVATVRGFVATESAIEALLLQQGKTVVPRFAAVLRAMRKLLRRSGAALTGFLLSPTHGRSVLGVHSVAWHPGPKAHIAVGALRAPLPPEWSVFHACPVAGARVSDVEHLLVGPGGVFTVKTQHHTGRHSTKRVPTIAGREVPLARAAQLLTQRVTGRLRQRMPMRASVRPVIVLADSRVIVALGKATKVKIVDAQDLQDWLVALPPVVDPAERLELAAVLANPATWSMLPSIAADDALSRFNALVADVRAARIQRTVVEPLIVVATFAGAVFVVIQFMMALNTLVKNVGG